jgi:hypothetical protein
MKITKMITVCLTLAVSLWVCCLSQAAEFHVSRSIDLQVKLAEAQANGEDDIIFLAAGTYVGTFSYSSEEANDLTIKPEADLTPEQVILDAESLGRLLYLNAGENEVNFVIERVTCKRGKAVLPGAGLFLETAGNINIVDCIITSNSSYSSNNGGGIYISSANAINFNKNVIMSNYAASSGGGIYVSLVNIIHFINNIIVNNNASYDGGLHIRLSSEFNFINNTVTGNKASSSSSIDGIYIGVSEHQAKIYIANNIIWGNDDGGDIYLTGGIVELYTNNYKGIAGSFKTSIGNIDQDPSFVAPEEGDYHLSLGSPCINSGYNEASNLPATDKDGNSRIINDFVDMGAYELTDSFSFDPHPADSNNNWTIEDNEFNNYNSAWKQGNTWTNGPNPIPLDFVSRAGFLKESGGTYHNVGGKQPDCWMPGSGE